MTEHLTDRTSSPRGAHRVGGVSTRSGLSTEWRRRHAARAGERAEQRALRRDLEAFSSPRDLAELGAILDRHADSDAAPVRDAIEWTRAS